MAAISDEQLETLSDAFNKAVLDKARELAPPSSQKAKDNIRKQDPDISDEQLEGRIESSRLFLGLAQLFGMTDGGKIMQTIIITNLSNNPVEVAEHFAACAVEAGKDTENKFSGLAADISREQGIFPDDAGEAYDGYEGVLENGPIFFANSEEELLKRMEELTKEDDEETVHTFKTPNMAKLFGF